MSKSQNREHFLRHRTLALLSLLLLGGCADPAVRFRLKMEWFTDYEKRPPNWPEVRRLMKRPVPKVGQPAPDFTLAMLDVEGAVTLSEYRAGRPLVLIFGSYT